MLTTQKNYSVDAVVSEEEAVSGRNVFTGAGGEEATFLSLNI